VRATGRNYREQSLNAGGAALFEGGLIPVSPKPSGRENFSGSLKKKEKGCRRDLNPGASISCLGGLRRKGQNRGTKLHLG